jgi:hypothetical protein
VRASSPNRATRLSAAPSGLYPLRPRRPAAHAAVIPSPPGRGSGCGSAVGARRPLTGSPAQQLWAQGRGGRHQSLRRHITTAAAARRRHVAEGFTPQYRTPPGSPSPDGATRGHDQPPASRQIASNWSRKYPSRTKSPRPARDSPAQSLYSFAAPGPPQ